MANDAIEAIEEVMGEARRAIRCRTLGPGGTECFWKSGGPAKEAVLEALGKDPASVAVVISEDREGALDELDDLLGDWGLKGGPVCAVAVHPKDGRCSHALTDAGCTLAMAPACAAERYAGSRALDAVACLGKDGAMELSVAAALAEDPEPPEPVLDDDGRPVAPEPEQVMGPLKLALFRCWKGMQRAVLCDPPDEEGTASDWAAFAADASLGACVPEPPSCEAVRPLLEALCWDGDTVPDADPALVDEAKARLEAIALAVEACGHAWRAVGSKNKGPDGKAYKRGDLDWESAKELASKAGARECVAAILAGEDPKKAVKATVKKAGPEKKGAE